MTVLSFRDMTSFTTLSVSNLSEMKPWKKHVVNFYISVLFPKCIKTYKSTLQDEIHRFKRAGSKFLIILGTSETMSEKLSVYALFKPEIRPYLHQKHDLPIQNKGKERKQQNNKRKREEKNEMLIFTSILLINCLPFFQVSGYVEK